MSAMIFCGSGLHIFVLKLCFIDINVIYCMYIILNKQCEQCSQICPWGSVIEKVLDIIQKQSKYHEQKMHRHENVRTN